MTIETTFIPQDQLGPALWHNLLRVWQRPTRKERASGFKNILTILRTSGLLASELPIGATTPVQHVSLAIDKAGAIGILVSVNMAQVYGSTDTTGVNLSGNQT